MHQGDSRQKYYSKHKSSVKIIPYFILTPAILNISFEGSPKVIVFNTHTVLSLIGFFQGILKILAFGGANERADSC
jgi:hypothetical protein